MENAPFNNITEFGYFCNVFVSIKVNINYKSSFSNEPFRRFFHVYLNLGIAPCNMSDNNGLINKTVFFAKLVL